MEAERFELFGKDCVIRRNHFVSEDSLYHNIKFIFPKHTQNSFHALLGITEKGQIVQSTNSYITDSNAMTLAYNKKHSVYSRINFTYETLVSRPVEYSIEEPVCSFMSAFDSVNFGHNLSVIIDFIHQYRKHNLTCPILLSEESKKYPNILRILELFFTDIRYIANDKVYKFSNVYFFHQVFFDILHHRDIIEEIRNLAIARVSAEKYKHKNIFIVKLINIDTNIVEKHTAFYSSEMIQRLEKNGYIVIHPEKMHIYDIIAYLTYATKIVTSTGAINYGHSIFFNRLAKWFFLHQGSPNVYFDHEKYTYIKCDYNLDTQIPSFMKILL